ncbi:hypothetical protein [uncultured Desulfovibrio sp.]|uniref:hypothetical protein n=1 Tax=uncultured Desulfovibrio sp. TaxID=167968 RepID=UPI0026100B61|nr:hypothetical protein [uncultured Desulfovibrio sp.]
MLRTRTCIGIWDKCRRIYKAGGGRTLWKRSARYAQRLLRRCCRCFLATGLPRSAPEELRRAGTFLILDHDAGGGANAFREQMAKRLLNEGRGLLVWQYLGGVDRYLLEWRLGKKCVRYRAQRLEECLDFLRSLAPETLFLNSIVGWPRIEATLDGIAALGANSRLEVFLHDFFAVCPAYPLLAKSGRFCGIPEDLNLCGRCLPGHPFAAPHTNPDVRTWRRVWQRFLLQADTITMADASGRKLVARVYPAIAEHIAVKPLAPLRHWQPLPAPLPPEAGEMTVIGVVGNIARHKGAAIVEDLARLVDERKLPLAITVIGELESSMHHPRLKVTGTYAHDRLPELLRRWKVAVCLVPSPLPETFCYAAQEVEMLGLPLVCLDLGAQGQRAWRYARGHVAPSPDAVGCLAAILAALELPDGGRDAAVEERGFQC